MTPSRRRFLRSAAAVGGLTGLAGCTGDGTGAQRATAENARVVSMVNTAFDPVRATVDPGTTVEWVNEDGFGHDVTAAQFHEAAADWSYSREAAPGETLTHTFEEAGVYEYYCTIHGRSTMCGVVLVGDASLDASLPCESDAGGGDGGYY